MENMSDDALLVELCKCRSCKNILEPPVMLTKEQGNLCLSCFETLMSNGYVDAEQAMENKPITMVVSHKRFTCMNEGCMEKFLFSELKSHHEICSYQNVPCVFFPSCIWKGRKSEYASHLLKLHSGCVISNYNDAFSVSISTQEDSDTLHILDTSSGPFVCRIKSNWIMSFIYCKIYNVLPDLSNNPQRNFMFKICFEDESFCSLEFSCLVVHKLETLQCFDLDEATVIDTKKIPTSLLKGDFVRHVIKFEDLNETVHMSPATLRLLECPVCNYLMRPPIYQCVTGHSVCSSCFPNLGTCPSCRGSLRDTRNYLLEEVIDKMKYPCIYRDFGCQILSTSISTHEASCSFKKYACIFSRCDYKGRYTELIGHLEVKHPKFFKQLPHLTFRSSIDNSVTRCSTVVWDYIFKVSFKIGASLAYWGVEVVQKQNGGPEFIYKISLTGCKAGCRKITISDQCYKMSDKHDDIFGKCLTLPTSLINDYVDNRFIVFTVKITKKKN